MNSGLIGSTATAYNNSFNIGTAGINVSTEFSNKNHLGVTNLLHNNNNRMVVYGGN